MLSEVFKAQVAPLPSAPPGYVPFTLEPNSSTYSMEITLREKATFTEALTVKVGHCFIDSPPLVWPSCTAVAIEQ